MEEEKILTLIKSNPLFYNLNEAELNKIIEMAEFKKISHGEDIVQEGEEGHEMYLLLDGLVEVLKKDNESGTVHQMIVLEEGEVIGEMALVDEPIRSATVRALKDLDLLVLPFTNLKKETSLFNQIIFNISKKLSQRLRKAGEKTVRALQAELFGAKVRIEMGRFLFIILILASSWIFVVTILDEFTSKLPTTTLVSIPMIIIFVFCFASHVKFSIYPKSYFGLSVQNWKKSVFEGVVFSIPFMFLAVAIKWILVNFTDKYYGREVFSLIWEPFYLLVPMIYVIFVPLQEFLARGVLQGSIKASLSGAHTTFWSILLSNLIFASLHAHISHYYALASFIGGIIWGSLYTRQWTLVSPSVSHAILGWWCLVFLGFGRLLAGH